MDVMCTSLLWCYYFTVVLEHVMPPLFLTLRFVVWNVVTIDGHACC